MIHNVPALPDAELDGLAHACTVVLEIHKAHDTFDVAYVALTDSLLADVGAEQEARKSRG